MADKLTPQEIRKLILESLRKRQNQLWVKRDELLNDTNLDDATLHPDFTYLLGKNYVQVPGPGPIDQLQFIPYAHMKITSGGVDYLDELTSQSTSNAQKPLLSVSGNHNTFHDVSVDGGVNVPGKGNQFSKTKIGRGTQPKEHKWFWWIMSIVGGVIALLISAYIFGVGR